MPTPAPPAPADFASAAMLRVLAQGMRELGLDPDAGMPAPSGAAATVALDDKRRLVASALAQGGIGCLALLGRGLHRHAHDPTHAALVSARDAQDLLARWARLERYIHSRHHVEVLAVSDRHAQLVHRSRPARPPPLPAEDLVVLGVLVALLEALGARQVVAWAGDVPVCPVPDSAALARAAERSSTATWTLRWTGWAAPPGRAGSGAAPAPPLAAPHAWPAAAQRAFDALRADLMCPPSLPALAQALGRAPRSLQRSLGRDGFSHTLLLAEARCQSAAWWLMHSGTPIAEVGFVCGYADQPHFTRHFRQRVGMTPLRYRQDFAVAPAACAS